MKISLLDLGPSPYECRDAWIRWMSSQPFPWAWFFVGTFRNNVSEHAASKAWLRWIRRVNRAALGSKRGRLQHVPWVRVIEGPPYGSQNHVHGLVGAVEHLDLRSFRDQWRFDNGLVKLRPFNPTLGGIRYTLKHVGFGADPDTSPLGQPPTLVAPPVGRDCDAS